MTSNLPAPFQATVHSLGKQWFALPSWMPIPGLGLLVNHAFVHAGREPMLVDTGLGLFRDDFIDSLGTVLDPADLQWIWLSHADPDHTGNLARVLELAPRARVLTGMLGLAKLQLAGMDVSRFQVIAPGDELEIGGRRLRAIRPPVYDAPETLGFHDEQGVLYAVDSFGALLPGVAQGLADIDDSQLRDGLVAWGAIDAPWQADLDEKLRQRRFGAIETLAPELVLTAHLPLGRRSGARLAQAALAAGRRLPSDMAALQAVVRTHVAGSRDVAATA